MEGNCMTYCIIGGEGSCVGLGMSESDFRL